MVVGQDLNYGYDAIIELNNIKEELQKMSESIKSLDAENLDRNIEYCKAAVGKINCSLSIFVAISNDFIDAFIESIHNKSNHISELFANVSDMVPEDVSACNDTVERNNDFRLFDIVGIIKDIQDQSSSTVEIEKYAITDDSAYTKNRIVFSSCREFMAISAHVSEVLETIRKEASTFSVNVKNVMMDILQKISEYDPNNISASEVEAQHDLVDGVLMSVSASTNKYVGITKLFNVIETHYSICNHVIAEFHEKRFKF